MKAAGTAALHDVARGSRVGRVRIGSGVGCRWLLITMCAHELRGCSTGPRNFFKIFKKPFAICEETVRIMEFSRGRIFFKQVPLGASIPHASLRSRTQSCRMNAPMFLAPQPQQEPTNLKQNCFM